jgi:hypothetical protein
MKLLDPTRPDDPRFDPHGEQGRRVLAAATARTVASRRFPRRRLLAGAALVATCVLAALVLTPAGGPPDARAALTESLDRMRGIDSGIVVMTIAGDRNEVRFDGEDMQWTSAFGTWQRVDGVEYENGKPTGSRTTENSFPDKLVAQVGKQSIVALAQRAPDFSARELPDGGFEYRATATAGDVFDAMPIAAGRAQGGAWKKRVPLEVTVKDGLVRRVRAGEEVTEYLSLGEPQSVERP